MSGTVQTDVGRIETGKFYSLTEVAALLSVHRETFGRIVKAGELKTTRIGKRKPEQQGRGEEVAHGQHSGRWWRKGSPAGRRLTGAG